MHSCEELLPYDVFPAIQLCLTLIQQSSLFIPRKSRYKYIGRTRMISFLGELGMRQDFKQATKMHEQTLSKMKELGSTVSTKSEIRNNP